MLGVAAVSSTNTSFSGSRSSWPSNHRCRRSRTSGRSCSLACADFMEWPAPPSGVVGSPELQEEDLDMALAASSVLGVDLGKNVCSVVWSASGRLSSISCAPFFWREGYSRKSPDKGPIPRRLRFGAPQESHFQCVGNTDRFNPAGNRSSDGRTPMNAALDVECLPGRRNASGRRS